MPSSRFLIASNTLGSSATSVTFSSIPSTYTDLVLKVSGRSQNATGFFYFTLNNTGTYSETLLRSTGATVDTIQNMGDGQMFAQGYLRLVGSGMTANTFNSVEIYIPNYAGSQNKLASAFSVTENNAATVQYTSLGAALSDVTAAVTSIECYTAFASGSSFFLYGIKNT